jgi:hypothetical protein
LAMNEMQTPWSMDQTKEKVIRNRFDILKRFLQQNKYHHTTLKLCSKQRSKQHLSTKRWLHICFDLRARYLFTVKDFTSIILQRSKQHLSTKRWLHICFDLRARYLFTVKDFTSGHSRNTNNKVSLHKFDCNIHSSSLDQSKEKVI